MREGGRKVTQERKKSHDDISFQIYEERYEKDRTEHLKEMLDIPQSPRMIERGELK